MRTFFKYTLILLFLAGCSDHSKDLSDTIPPLYSGPLTVKLDTANGYKINFLSGDSIKPLINSIGDTIITGIPVSIKSTSINAKSFAPKIINAGTPVITTPESNIYPIKSKPEVILVNDSLYQFHADENINRIIKHDDSSVITGKTFPAAGVKIPLHEPQSLKVLPMAIKDNATANIQYFDIAQGLPYSYIKDIIEDKNGYIWFAVDGNGVCKYDGAYLTTYTQKEGLIDNRVTSLMEDYKGNIWIGTQSGISVFDGAGFTQFTEKEGLPDNRIIHFTKDTKGNIWITTEKNGLTKFDGRHFIIYSEKEGLLYNSAAVCTEDSRGRIWLANNWGIVLFDGKKFIPFHNELNFLSVVYSIVEDSRGNMWFGSSREGLIKYDGKSFTHYTQKNGLTNNSIMQLITDKKDNIWIATRYGGVMKFDGTHFTAYGKEQGLSEDKTSTIMQDARGNIWIATLGGGINKLSDGGFSEKISLKDLGNSRVRPMMKDAKGNLWFGTEAGGLYQYDGTNLKAYSSVKIFDMHGFRSMMADAKGNLWFGEADGSGIYKYKDNRFLYYSSVQKQSDNLSICEDRNQSVWIGTSSEGVIVFDGSGFKHYSEKQGFPSDKIFAIAEDNNGSIWLGTDAGLIKFDGKFFTTISAKQGFFGKGVTSIIEDKEGNLWLGTLGAGVCKFNGKQFTYYTEKQGLSYNDVWSAMQDRTGQIWAGTDKGLSLLIPGKDSLQTYTVYNFGLEDGLKATDFNLHSVCIDNGNRIWWGTGKALVSRDLNEPFTTAHPHSLSLNQIAVNGKFYDFRNLPGDMKNKISFSSIAPFSNCPDKLTLAYNQNHLNFIFSAIDWQAPHKLQYSYRLVGWGNTWSVPSGTTTAEYHNLPHGKYEFQVKAIGQSQTWTSPIRYSFTILPPWWLTWWFKTFVGLLAIGLIFLTIRFIYLYQLRKQKALLEKQLAVQYERQRISSEMHDDIGAGLSGIKLMTEMVKSKVKDEETNIEIEKIYQSVGDISSKMKEVIWSLNAENDKLSNLVFYIQKQARQWLEHYPCRLTVDIPADVPDTEISGNTRRNIFLMVKEAVHNIIKHSGADKVNISMVCNDNLVITVSDNGKGMANTKSDNGNGMKNMQQRIEKLGGKLFIIDENGLTLTFEIPLKPTI